MVKSVTEPGLRVLVLGGAETRFHRFEEVTPALAELVARAGHRPTVMRASEALDTDLLRRFDAVASITTGGVLDEDQESALLGAVHEGRNDLGRALNFLGVHGAACSFQNSAPYVDMLGGRFVRHPPLCEFEVEVDLPDHPVTRGVAGFTTYDECYVLDVSDAVEVLISTKSPEGDSVRLPLGWAKRYGAGKVVYLAPGHAPEQLENPGLCALVAGALAWFQSAHAGSP